MEGKRFAELRIKAGFSQDAAAKIIGVERSTISKWETNVAFPHSSILPIVAKTYHCAIDDFYASEAKHKAEAG